jgi:hypothetical protein
MCRETVHPPNYVNMKKGVENGTTRLVIDTTRPMNLVERERLLQRPGWRPGLRLVTRNLVGDGSLLAYRSL